MSEEGGRPAAGGPDDPGDPGGSGREAGRSEAPWWPGFWPWLVTTAGLALVAGALWGYLETREPQVVEVVGPTPPPAEPAPELVRRAVEFGRQIELKQEQLADRIAALDPPRCTPPETIDFDLLEQVREREAPNIRRWRKLLVPVSLAPAIGRLGAAARDNGNPGGDSGGNPVRRAPPPAGEDAGAAASDRRSTRAPAQASGQSHLEGL